MRCAVAMAVVVRPVKQIIGREPVARRRGIARCVHERRIFFFIIDLGITGGTSPKKTDKRFDKPWDEDLAKVQNVITAA